MDEAFAHAHLCITAVKQISCSPTPAGAKFETNSGEQWHQLNHADNVPETYMIWNGTEKCSPYLWWTDHDAAMPGTFSNY